MGFCSDREYEEFLATVPYFENMITRSGIVLIKYWLSISLAEQRRRLLERLKSPFKEWKLSPMDINPSGAGKTIRRPKRSCSNARIVPKRPGGSSTRKTSERLG